MKFLLKSFQNDLLFAEDLNKSQILLTNYLTSYLGTKMFSCDECEKKFRQKRDLARHKYTHTGEKPFSCDTCGKKFARKDKMRIHMRAHKKNQ